MRNLIRQVSKSNTGEFPECTKFKLFNLKRARQEDHSLTREAFGFDKTFVETERLALSDGNFGFYERRE